MKVTFAVLSALAIGAEILFAVLAAREPSNRAWLVGLVAANPFSLVGCAYLLFGVVFPRIVFRAPADERDSRVRAVRASGPALAEADVSGSLGSFSAGVKMLHVEARPDGFVVKVKAVGTAAVRRDEIRAVEEKQKLWARYLEIEHVGAHVVSPIRLECARDVMMSQALKSFVAAPAA
jgi:hypothetical protein